MAHQNGLAGSLTKKRPCHSLRQLMMLASQHGIREFAHPKGVSLVSYTDSLIFQCRYVLERLLRGSGGQGNRQVQDTSRKAYDPI